MVHLGEVPIMSGEEHGGMLDSTECFVCAMPLEREFGGRVMG
jgi:hypothetical protein